MLVALATVRIVIPVLSPGSKYPGSSYAVLTSLRASDPLLLFRACADLVDVTESANGWLSSVFCTCLLSLL